MSPENTKNLFDRFKFFHPEKSLRESLMSFGFEHDDGWFKIIWNLCEKIESLAKDTFEVLQVKEKFGTLRFYTSSSTNEIEKFIDEAEELSSKTCELCGQEGSLHTSGGWLKTLCSKCATESGRYVKEENL